MNINLIYRHPCELEIESLLGREEPYPDTFTPADCATERLTRARTGLVHVMNEIVPSVGGKRTNCWANMSYRIIQARRNMNNFLTFHTEATPDGVNIMYRLREREKLA